MIQTDSTAEPQFAAFVAIDWADQKHAWSLQAAGSDQREADEMKHTPEPVGAWVSMLSARFAGQPIAVALEQSHGALVFMLGQYADLHLYPIHPRAAAQFRAALYPSGAKDDPVDADLLLDMLVLHRKHIRPLRPDNQPTRLVQHQVEARRRLVNEKTRQVQRLTAKLKIYFPQVLDWFDKMDSPLVGALLHRWPTLPDLQRARSGTIRSFCAAQLPRCGTDRGAHPENPPGRSSNHRCSRDPAGGNRDPQLGAVHRYPARGHRGTGPADRYGNSRASGFRSVRFLPGSRPSVSAAVVGGLRLAPRTLRHRRRGAETQRHRPRGKAERKGGIGAFSPCLPQVPSANLA